MNTEHKHMGIRLIAMESLMISIIAKASDHQLEPAREMASFISQRPGFTHHPRTDGGAAQPILLLDQARHFRCWVEGHALS